MSVCARTLVHAGDPCPADEKKTVSVLQLKRHIDELRTTSENLAQDLKDLEYREELLSMGQQLAESFHSSDGDGVSAPYESATWRLRESNRSSAVEERIASFSGRGSSLSGGKDGSLYADTLASSAGFSPASLARSRRENSDAASSLVQQLRAERERVAKEVETYAEVEARRMNNLETSQ